MSLIDTVENKQGVKVHIVKGIPPGSGIGSSSASAAAAVVGVNELLNKPLENSELLVHGMAGEAVASGGFHADNIAPALFGGIILISSYEPLDILNLPVPKKLFSPAVLPDFIVNTLDARRLLPKRVPLKSAVEQAGNLAGFTLGLHESDFDLLGRSMVDLFAEPIRAELIPGYNSVRQSAMDAGAIGCGISGSGPALFALSDSLKIAEHIGITMVGAFKKAGLNPDMDLSTWQNVGNALDKLKASGNKCPLTTAWQSWVHLENLSAYHNVAFATKENGFAGLDTELAFNGPVQIKHIQAMGDWAKEGKFIYSGRRNEGGKAFRAGEWAIYTEEEGGYGGRKKNAEKEGEIRH